MLTYNQWKKEAETGLHDDYRIGDDILLLKSSEFMLKQGGPFLSDMAIAIILIKGTMELTIDMTDYKAEAPCMTIILPKQTFKIIGLTENVEGTTIMMSGSFSDSLFNEYAAFNQLRKTIGINPVTYLEGGLKDAFQTYLNLMENLIKSPAKAYRLEAAKHLTLSMFYGIVFALHDLNEIKPTD